ncbi:MAG: hypothetical protein IV090_04940 [Candidatus Sericytochromatia bacterium]|nr:hypothetical protein [Candidatus Sericytochromatia bacterium]
MSIQALSNPSAIVATTPVAKPQTEAPKPAASEAKPKSGLDTFTNTLAGAAVAAQTTGLVAAGGAGVMTYLSLKEAPVFHRVLLSALNAGGGGMAGAVVGGLSGAVAGAFAKSKSEGAMYGAATGAVAGAAAVTALNLKMGKGMDVKMMGGGALLGAALGAVGGFAGSLVKND